MLLKILLPAILLATVPAGAPRRGMAKLAILVGTVEVKGAEDADYKPIASGGELEAKTWVRTGPKAKAVFDFNDGTELRIDENSEILVDGTRNLELKVGEIFLVAARNPTPFAIKTQYSPIEFDNAILDVSFRHRDPNDPATKTISRTVTSIYSLNGTITVGSKRYTHKLTTGYWCTLVDATLNTPDPLGDPTIPTRWVHELLMRRGKYTPEIESRLESMYQMLGRYKTGEDLSESGYRSLGEFSAPFLVKYLKYPPTPQETTRRRATAKILADVATKAQIPDLIGILKEPDADSRAAGAKGLERLAGTNLKFDETYWRGASLDAGQKAWDEWVKKNPPPKK
jgi:FecR-like protein